MPQRVDNIDWLPIRYVSRDCRPGSAQIIVLYRKGDVNQCYLEYTTSNPDYAVANAEAHGYTEFAILVDD